MRYVIKNKQVGRVYVALGLTAALVVGLLTWLAVTRDGSSPSRRPASTIDLDRRACLLTTGDADAATVGRVWAGMRQAADGTPHLLVQRFELPPRTKAATMLTTLTQMRCRRIVTVGAELARAAFAQGAGDRAPGLIVISDDSGGPSGPTTLSPSAVTSASIAQAVGG